MTADASREADSERTHVWRPAMADIPTAIRHVLLLRQGAGAPRRIPLTTSIRIGRAPGNDVVLASPQISRSHCDVSVRGNDVVVTDLGSTNGVYIDGRRVDGAEVLLADTRIALGPYVLHYKRGSAEDLAAAEAHDLEEARAIAYIQALLPPPLADGHVTADWHFQPSARLGGDAFGYRWLDDDRMAMFLLDVSGHGTGSALMAASAANLLRGAGLRDVASDPAAVLTLVNATFLMEDHDGLFLSLWYAVYDRTRRLLRYSSAGHHPSCLLRREQVTALATRAPAIGMSDRARFGCAEVDIPRESCLYVFSDGLFEVTYPDGRNGTLDELLPLLGTRPSPADLVQSVHARTQSRPFDDDVSVIRFVFH